MKKPTAKVVSQTHNRTVWTVTWPTGKTYYATTYPNSDLLFLETAAKRRVVATGVATRITPLIREAIARATP